MIPRIDITADVTRKASSHAWSSRAETLSTDITSCSLFELQDKPQHFSTYLDTKHNNDDHQLWNKSLFAQDEENRSQTSTFSDFEDLTQTAATMNSSRSSISSESKLNKSQNNRQQTHANDVPYHILRRSQKQIIVLLVSLAASFSPLSSNIYFPALDLIADDLKTSNATFALSVSIYMVAQGIAPSFWGPLADNLGRRQVLIYTLLLYLAANLGLALTSSFPLLMVFRFLQATGSSSTISIGAGVITDIAPPAERGGFLGTFSGVRQFALAFGPVLGGVVSQAFGYHAIFWLLVAFAVFAVIAIAFFLPETLRRIAGNGSVQLRGIQHEPLYQKLWLVEKQCEKRLPIPAREEITWQLFVEPFAFLLEKDVACVLFFGAVVYTVWSMVTSSPSVLLSQNHHLNVLEVGLCFLPNGVGCVIGSYISGRQLDTDFKAAQESYQYRHGPTTFSKGNLPDDFPLEHARLVQLTTLIPSFVFATIVFGFSIGPSINLALPLMAQFVIGYSSTAVLNLNNTLTVDLYPGKGASATAVNNLARCLIGAVGVSLTNVALERLRPHILFSVLGCVVVVSFFDVLLEWRYGMRWRSKRAQRLLAQAEQTSTS